LIPWALVKVAPGKSIEVKTSVRSAARPTSVKTVRQAAKVTILVIPDMG
jgi:hypothetical protein